MLYTQIDSPLGPLTAAGEGDAITGLWLPEQKYFPAVERFVTPSRLPVFLRLERWLADYFAGKAPEISFPLAPEGSAFRRQVWRQLQAIPYGSTATYGEIGRAIGCKSGQAVGGAVGHNPISILIPCHRVIGQDGSLTGYAGGLAAKEFLLRLEGVL